MKYNDGAKQKPAQDEKSTHSDNLTESQASTMRFKTGIKTCGPVREGEEQDCDIVDWDGAEDPENPMNWPPVRKWCMVGLVSAITFNTSMAATIFAPAVPAAQAEFHNDSSAISALLVSIYVIGFAIGPLFLSPASELYGRSNSIHASNIVFVIASVLTTVSVNIAMLLIFRLIMGISSAVPLTIGGGIIADLIEKQRRGRALSVWIIGPVLGPVVGPVVGGYLSLDVGWRWTNWLVVISSGVLTIVSFLLFRETYGPRILALKTRRLRKKTRNTNLRSRFDDGQKPTQLFLKALSRPTKMLLRIPMVMVLSAYLAIFYGYMYLLFSTFTEVFETEYGFNSGEAGLAYLGLGVGFVLSLIALGKFSDLYVKRQTILHGESQPEDRLPPLAIGALSTAIGLIWYGWTVQYHIHWIAPVVGTAFCSLGIMFVMMPIQTYLIDAYTIYAASAIGANTVVRSVSGAVLPLAGPPLYGRLGYGWGNTLLAFIAVAFAPLSLLLVRYGRSLRQNSRFQPTL